MVPRRKGPSALNQYQDKWFHFIDYQLSQAFWGEETGHHLWNLQYLLYASLTWSCTVSLEFSIPLWVQPTVINLLILREFQDSVPLWLLLDSSCLPTKSFLLFRFLFWNDFKLPEKLQTWYKEIFFMSPLRVSGPCDTTSLQKCSCVILQMA